MLKKSFLFLTGMLFSYQATAASDAVQDHPDSIEKNSGFYAGLRGGLSPLRTKVKETNLRSHEVRTSSPKTNNWFFGGHIGYRHIFHNNFLLGLETFADVGNIDQKVDLRGRTSSNDHVYEKYHAPVAWGIAAKIGAKFGRWETYAKVGTEFSRINYQQSHKYFKQHHRAQPAQNGEPAKGPWDEYDYHNHSQGKHYTGALFGLGVVYDFDRFLSLGVEFKHVVYQTKTHILEGLRLSETIRPRSSSIMGTLTFRFGNF